MLQLPPAERLMPQLFVCPKFELTVTEAMFRLAEPELVTATFWELLVVSKTVLGKDNDDGDTVARAAAFCSRNQLFA